MAQRSDKAQEWLQYFQRYAAFKQLSENAALALFALLMRDTANTWFLSLPETVRNNYTQAVERFSTKFAPAPITLWRRASELWSRDQRQEESVEQYFSDMMRKAREVNATADMTRYALMKGLRPTYRSYVIQQNPTTVEQLLDAAKVAEATISDAEPMGTPEILEAINRLERRVSAPITDQRRVSFRRASTPPPRPASRDRRDPPTYGTGWSEPPRRPSAPQPGYGPRRSEGAFTPRAPPPMARRQPTTTLLGQSGCTYCARIHAPGQCTARGKSCRRCGRRNHFAICCRSAPPQE